MIKYQKEPLLVVADKPFMIRHKATETHNEVTVAVVKYALPLNGILPNGSMALNPNIFKVIFNATSGYPDINLEFNKNSQAPAFIFTVKAKTERRGKDVHNQELADKIVLAKANLKACAIVRTIINGNKRVDGLVDYYKKVVARLTEADGVLANFSQRETTYIEKV